MLALIFACRSEETVFVDTSAWPAPYVFFASLDAGGELVSVSEVSGVIDGRLSFGAPPIVQPGEGVAEVVMIGLDDERLSRREPMYDPNRARTITAHAGATCPRGHVDYALGRIDVPLPADAIVLRIDAVNPALAQPVGRAEIPALDGIVLGLPIDPDRCREPNLVLEPFAVRGNPFFGARHGLNTLDAINLDDLARVDRERIVVTGNEWAWLVERGELWTDRPGSSVLLDRSAHALGIAAVPGEDRVVITGHIGTSTGAIWDLTVDRDRGLVLTRTTTLASGPLDRVAIEPGGHLLAYGSGQLVSRAPGEARPIVRPIADELVNIALTGDPERPFVLGGNQSVIYVSDATASSPLRLSASRSGFDGLRIRAPIGFMRDGALELWAGGSRGFFARTTDVREFEQVFPYASPAYTCATIDEPECGHLIVGGTYREMVHVTRGGRDRLYALVDNCTRAVNMAVPEACGGALELRDVENQNGGEVQLVAIDVTGDLLTIASSRGSIYEVEL